MSTVKRTPREIDTDLDNYSKYWNTLNFNGIVQDSNIFNVDQDSFVDSENIYVDEDNNLISREPLLEVSVPSNVATDKFIPVKTLIDIKYVRDITLYIYSYPGTDESGETITKYVVYAYQNGVVKKIAQNSYNISIFNQYIILWRNFGARVLDINNFSSGWQDLKNFVDIPVTKVTAGSSVKTFSQNLFTDAHNEVYLIKNDLQTILPSSSAVEEAERSVEVITTNETQYLTFDDDLEYNNLQIFKRLSFEFEIDDIRQSYTHYVKKSTVIVTCDCEYSRAFDYMLVSLNSGNTFVKVTYPTTGWRYNEGVSDDGQYFFYVQSTGVYRLSLDDFTWTVFKLHGNQSIIIESSTTSRKINVSHYKTGENFCFVRGSYLYVLSQTLYENGYQGQLCQFSGADFGDWPAHDYNYDRDAIRLIPTAGGDIVVTFSRKKGGTTIPYYIQINWFKEYNGEIIKGVESLGYTSNPSLDVTNKSLSMLFDGEPTATDASTYINVKIPVVYQGASLYLSNAVSLQFNSNASTANDMVALGSYFTVNPMLTCDDYYFPKKLSNDTYIVKSRYTSKVYIADYIYNGISGEDYSDTLHTISAVDGVVPTSSIVTDDDRIYIMEHNYPESSRLYTNIFADEDVIVVSYSFPETIAYSEVPTLTYSGSELYLAFDNKLMITNNVRSAPSFAYENGELKINYESTGDKIYLNLSEVYSQYFSNDITGMINISTTELAIFFDNKIFICTKQEDDTYGYTYYYNETRLSLGLRDSDSIINTLDGAATVFPTTRGLALMTYQEYMATTDQILNFVSDKIGAIWREFYKAGKIKITQKQNYIYFINDTNMMLMFDTRTSSWWKFALPIKATKLITNQDNLIILNETDTPYEFDYNNTTKLYYDYIEGVPTIIPWSMTSQRLHFKYPNHYKNIRQLIFQLVQTSDFKNTVQSQIKIYRKVIDYGEPQLVAFNVDEYRTFVKRFNYWKINELQWSLKNDEYTATPAQLKLNGIGIKYEIGEEVR